MRSRKMLASLALVALTASACNAADGEGTVTTGDGARMIPVSIEQVLTFDGELPVIVKGTLFADANGVRLCEAIGESFPVQCLGDQITVTDLELFPEYSEMLVGDEEVRTSDGEVDVVGFYSEGNLRIDPAAAGADAS